MATKSASKSTATKKTKKKTTTAGKTSKAKTKKASASKSAKSAAKTTKSAAGKKPAKAAVSKRPTKASGTRKAKASGNGGSPDQRAVLIQQAAYFIAEKRGFEGGDPVQDWLMAERQVDELLKNNRL